MPGYEIINYKEKRAINKLFSGKNYPLIKRNKVRAFELLLKKKIKCKHALAVTSGTAATKIALKAVGIKKGDEVITQAFNFVAAVEAIIDIGAIPVIANVDKTLNMCPKDLARLISKKTKAIIPVHMLGVPCKMSEILSIVKKNRIKVVEDNCEAFGAKYNNKFLGTLGDAGAISFDGGKVITTGEGGMVITNNRNIDKYSREYHDHGHENNPNFLRGQDTKSIVGFNFRMTEMQASIGIEQLKKLNFIISENKKRYNKLLFALGKLVELREIPAKSSPIYDTFIFFVKNKNLKKSIIKILNKEKIGTKNLPDAVEWHCAAYWNHAIPKSKISRIKYTKRLLETAIAIPVLLKKKTSFYSRLSIKIKNCLLNN